MEQSKYAVWLIKYEGWRPTNFHENPKEGIAAGKLVLNETEEFDLDFAGGMATGWNIGELWQHDHGTSPSWLWAITLSKEDQPELGGIVFVESASSLN